MTAFGTSAVIPGHRVAMSPEPRTDAGDRPARRVLELQRASASVLGSGLAPLARPGMTAVAPLLVIETGSRP